MQTKITVRHHFTPTVIKKSDGKCWWGCREIVTNTLLVGMKNGALEVPEKVKQSSPAISLLGITFTKQMKTYTGIFIAI